MEEVILLGKYLQYLLCFSIATTIVFFALEINREIQQRKVKVAILKDRIYREANRNE